LAVTVDEEVEGDAVNNRVDLEVHAEAIHQACQHVLLSEQEVKRAKDQSGDDVIVRTSRAHAHSHWVVNPKGNIQHRVLPASVLGLD